MMTGKYEPLGTYYLRIPKRCKDTHQHIFTRIHQRNISHTPMDIPLPDIQLTDIHIPIIQLIDIPIPIPVTVIKPINTIPVICCPAPKPTAPLNPLRRLQSLTALPQVPPANASFVYTLLPSPKEHSKNHPAVSAEQVDGMNTLRVHGTVQRTRYTLVGRCVDHIPLAG